MHNFVKFAEMLCADETDFDALTNPTNIDFYKILQQFSKKFQRPIPRYISILEKICDNKTLGIYTEFQEVEFFFQEMENKDFKSTFEDCNRILTLQTQRIFSEFISIDFSSQARKILNQNKDKIENESALVLYIFGNLFFRLHLSNKNEILLMKHIEFFIRHLSKNNFVQFEEIEQKKYFTQFDNLSTRLNLFFESNDFSENEKSIALLKDYALNDGEIVRFINDFQKIKNGESVFIEKTSTIENLANIVFQMDEKNESILFLQLIFLIAEREIVNFEKIENARELFRDGIEQKIINILKQNKSKITDEKMLCFYVYAELYYCRHLSNKKEILLLDYIEMFIASLVKHGLRFEQTIRQQYFIHFDLSQRFQMLFKNENIDEKNIMPYLKDYSLNNTEIVKFCEKLQKIFAGGIVQMEHTISVEILKKVIDGIKGNNNMILFLRTLFSFEQKNITLAQIEFVQNKIIFKELIKGHFMNPALDIQCLDSYKASLKDKYEPLKFLLAKEKNFFNKIIQLYQINNTADEIANFISDVFEHPNTSEKKKFQEIIKSLYSIIIDEFKLHFLLGDSVCDNNVNYGEIKEISIRADKFYYTVRLQIGTTYYISAENADALSLAKSYSIGDTFYDKNKGEGKIVGIVRENEKPYYLVVWQDGKLEYKIFGSLNY